MQIDRHIALSSGWIAGPAFGVAMMAAPSYFKVDGLLAGWLFWSGIVVFLATLLSVFIFSVRERENSRMAIGPVILMALGMLVFGVGLAWLVWSNKEVESKVGSASEEKRVESQINVPAPLLDSQLREIQEVDDFIGKKDEIALRETFDIPNLVKFNILFQRRIFAPNLVTKEESVEVDKFFLGGKARVDARYAKMSDVNNRLNIEWIPGKIGYINTSVKYNSSRQKLSTLASSSKLPSSVAKHLNDFSDVIERNSTMITEILNECISQNPNYIVYNDSFGSPYYGSCSGLYWKKFEQLKPISDSIRNSIREYLKIP